MGHDYTEWMSAALDGRLTPQERVEWGAHLADCPRCQARWNALHELDYTFKNTARMAPAPGFTARFAERLSMRYAARRARKYTFAGAGVLATGALTALVIIGWLLAWQLPALSGTLAGTPSQLGGALQVIAQWWVLIRALSETGQSLVSLIPLWVAALVLGCAWFFAMLAAAWSGVIWRVTRQRAPAFAISAG